MDSSDPRAQTTDANAYGSNSNTGQAFSNATGDDSAALWPQTPVQLARGRQPRDALAKIIPYNVSSMDEFEAALREYLSAPPEQPEHTEAQLSFWIGTSFMVWAPSQPSQPSQPAPQQPSQQQQHQQQHQHQQHQQQQHQQQQHQQQQHQHQQHQQQHQPPPHLAQPNPHAPPGYQPANGFPTPYGGPSHAYQSVSDPAMALTLPPSFQQPAMPNGAVKKPEQKVSLSIMEALQPTADPKDKMRKQRAIAKCCVEAIQRTDGYRYSFHNCWNSREDDSFRFSYYCNDSLLNKDRAANGKGAKLGKRATKPVYDCKGVLSIKFSATKEALDVFYKHVPVHKTYEERAPPPRKDSKRRKFLEENDPEALARLISRPKDDSAEPMPRPKKKKPSKPEPSRPSNTSLESDLRAQSLQSLLLLIRDDPSAPPEPPPPEPEPPVQQPILQSPIQPPQSQPAQQQQQQQQQRKRPRNSCDVCKVKKTKCDGVRPVCQTCVDKKRQCLYSEPPLGDDRRPSMAASEPVRQVPTPSNELSELEKMKKELEEAKARIQQLEQEKQKPTTPVQTPQTALRPQSQPQPQPHVQPQQRPSIPKAPTQSHTQQTQQQQVQQRQQVAAQNHRQQLQQLNQVAQRRNSPQQMAYNLDGQPVQQQQRLQSPRQLSQTAQQQLQAAAQAMPLQAQQSYFTAANHAPYGALDRTMTQGSISSQSAQNTLSAQNSMSSSTGLGQTQQQSQLHNSGSLASGGSVDASSLYGSVGRNDLNWTPATYYGYQGSQQQPQQDQWGAARGSNVFR